MEATKRKNAYGECDTLATYSHYHTIEGVSTLNFIVGEYGESKDGKRLFDIIGSLEPTEPLIIVSRFIVVAKVINKMENFI